MNVQVRREPVKQLNIWKRFTLALIPIITFLTAQTVSVVFLDWRYLNVPAQEIRYGDLRTITGASGCIVRGSEWNITSESCSSLGTPYNYPSIWAKSLALIGVTEDETIHVGIALSVFFLIGIFLITMMSLRKGTCIRTTLIVSIASISPVVMLATERGNVDLFVFFLVCLATYLLVKNHILFALAALGLATVLKIFPLGAFLSLLPMIWSKRWVLYWTILVILGAFLSMKDEVGIIIERTPQQAGASFGASVVPLLLADQFNQSVSADTVRQLSIFLVLLSAIILLILIYMAPPVLARGMRTHWSPLVVAVRSNSRARLPILANGGILTLAYFAGTNFDYRLIFFIPIVAALSQFRMKTATAVATFILVLTFLDIIFLASPLAHIIDLIFLALFPLAVMTLISIAVSDSAYDRLSNSLTRNRNSGSTESLNPL